MRTAEMLRFLVLAAQREGNRQLTVKLRDLDLTPAQSEVLRILGDHEPLSLSGLGAMLVCDSGSNPSRLVARLIGAGFVARTPGVDDKREVTLSLTPAGRALDAAVRAIEAEFYSDLDRATEGTDLESVVELLQRITYGSPAALALQNRIDAERA